MSKLSLITESGENEQKSRVRVQVEDTKMVWTALVLPMPIHDILEIKTFIYTPHHERSLVIGLSIKSYFTSRITILYP